MKTVKKKTPDERVTIRIPKGTSFDDLRSMLSVPDDERVWITTKALKVELLMW